MDKEIKDILVELLEGQKRLESKIDNIQSNSELFEKVVIEQFDKMDSKIEIMRNITKDNLYDITALKKQIQ